MVKEKRQLGTEIKIFFSILNLLELDKLKQSLEMNWEKGLELEWSHKT
jgi:hypothetical protein